MSYAHRFMVVPDANVVVARTLVKQLADPPAADNMWTVGLSPTGTGTITHWISSGMIDAGFASLFGDSNITYAVYQAKGGTTLTLSDIQALYAATPMGTYIRSDTQGQEQACIAALGLKLMQGTIA